MKTIKLLTLFLVSIILITPSSANNAKVKLELKEGQKIVFSYEHQKVIEHKSKSKTRTGTIVNKQIGGVQVSKNIGASKNKRININKWEIWVEVIDKLNQNKFILDLTPKRYVATFTPIGSMADHYDSKFPPISEEANYLDYPTCLYDLLRSLKIKVGLDLAKNELILLENEEQNDRIVELFKKEGVVEEDIKNLKTVVLEKVDEVLKITEEYLLHFNNASLFEKGEAQLNDKDYLVDRSEKELKVSSCKNVNEDGRTYNIKHQAILSLKNGIPLESIILKVDSVLNLHHYAMSKVTIDKKSYYLIEDTENIAKEITISGYFEKPQSKNIKIYFSSGRGGNFSGAILNDQNKFSITVPYEREGLFLVENINKQTNIGSVDLFYAQPGDHLKFDVLGGEKHIVKHYGDRIIENKALNDNKHFIFTSTPTFYGYLHRSTLIKAPDKVDNTADLHRFVFTDHFMEISQFPKLSNRFVEYYKNELMMHKLQVACEALSPFSHNLKIHQSAENKPLYFDLRHFIDNFQYTLYYNENGYFSQNAIDAYVRFWQDQNTRFTNRNSFPIDFRFNKDWTQNAKNQRSIKQNSQLDLVLAGSALVRKKTEFFYFLESITEDHPWEHLKTVKEYAKEIYKCSRDEVLNEKIENKIDELEHVYSGNIYREKMFLTPSGENVSIQDYLGEKPCVIGISSNWGTNRYYFDDISRNYPDVNAIIINEGDDFEAWKEYLQKANPSAIQLFLEVEDNTLKSLFKHRSGLSGAILFDRNGDLMNYNADLNTIEYHIKKAKNAPLKKKEVNKSTLVGIIWFLVGSLLLFLLGFLYFRIRVRQKLKRQTLQKRLQELRLNSIRAQMNPHFLFNSLNSVQNLIQKNKGREAHLYLSDFAGLIRKVMKNSKQEEVSLAEELDTLNQYVTLEQLRFDFDYIQHVDEAIDQNNYMVPSMILQPIAENAIFHGLQEKDKDRTLKVEVFKKVDSIQIILEDNGIGIEASKELDENSNGIGLALSEERLKILNEKYGGKYSIILIDLLKEGKQGTRVEINIPDEL